MSGQDNFDAPSQLGFQRHGVAKFTATKSWIKTPRHRRDEPSKTKDIQHQCLLGVQHRQHDVTCVSCDVLLPVRRRLTCKRRVVSKPNFGSQLWKRNGYICVYFYWPPGPNPVVTISTRVGPGSRLECYQGRSEVRAGRLSSSSRFRLRAYRTVQTGPVSSRSVHHGIFPHVYFYTHPSAAARTAPNGVKERASFCLVFS